jgi:hypothetical protein
VDQSPVKPSRRGFYAGLMFLGLVVISGTGYWYYSTVSRPGRIELSTVPADATVLIDNVKIGDRSPVSVDRPPGPYTLSVTRDGYVRNDQNVELKAGQPLALAVTLEPSPDTGFELTSEPPGGLVWLDGSPINGASGQQARTDFRAFRIPPGHHVIEIKGEARFKPWRQDVDIEPGAIRKVHATLIPSSGGPIAAAKPAPTIEPPPQPPAGSGTIPVASRKSAGGGSSDSGGGSTSSGATGSSSASSGGTLASAGSSTRRKRVRETEEGSELGGDEAPAPRESSRASESSAECSITINSVPWSEVWIDGKNTNRHTPFVDYKLPCGKHKIAFKRPDMQIDHNESINVKPGQTFKQRYTLPVEE